MTRFARRLAASAVLVAVGMFGSAQTALGVASNHPPVAIFGVPNTPMGMGYDIVARDGGVFTFGDAPFHGSLGGQPLNAPIVDGVGRPGGGYWLAASDGGVFAFNAPFYGSMGGQPLNRPIVGIAATLSGNGYWLVASDGGVFAFGDAQFHGSMGGQPLNAPIVGMAAAPNGGYWLVAADGGVFAFGAPFHGSMGGKPLSAPVVDVAAAPDGGGYLLLGADGGVFAFGSAGYFGRVTVTAPPASNPSVPSNLRQRIVDIAFQELRKGVVEVPRGSNIIPGNPYQNGSSTWCSHFASWVWQRAGVPIPITPLAKNMLVWAQDHTTTHQTPQVGDAVVTCRADCGSTIFGHVAIVVGVRPNGQIQTIGGNESDRVDFSEWFFPTRLRGFASPDGGGCG